MAKERSKTGSTEAARRREQFVLAYAATGNATAAAVAAGYAPNSARQQGAYLMSDPALATRAREAREQFVADQAAAFERQTASLRSAADQAILSLVEAAKSAKSEMARVQAAVAILDRAGHKPIERVEAKNEHTFPDSQAVADEVDSRLDRIIGAVPTGGDSSGDSSTTH